MKTWMAALSALLVAAHAFSETTSFDADPTGRAPIGWTCGSTGKGLPQWTVEANASAPSRPNVLQQAGTAAFPWCVKNTAQAANGVVEVKFKPISGKEDQAGGVVWRWKDANNYYVARANALEGNVSLYYTINGARKTIAYKNAPVARGAWNTLSVAYQDDAIEVSLDGQVYIEAKDRHIPTAGKAGVWTKADSVTLFDDFRWTGAAQK